MKKNIQVKLSGGKVVHAGVGRDVDFSQDVINGADGKRITSAEVHRTVAEIERGVGRPSLSERGQISPSLSIRLPAQLKAIFEERAVHEGVKPSVLARRLVEDYVGATPVKAVVRARRVPPRNGQSVKPVGATAKATPPKVPERTTSARVARGG